MAKQLNIFVENRPGRIKSISDMLGKNKINVIAFTIQDRGDFGLMKLLVDKPQAAQLALTDKGFAAALKEVFVVSVKDKCGNLYKLTNALSANKINIVDAHGFIMEPHKRGICSLEISGADHSRVKKIIEKSGFDVLSEEEIAELT